MTQPSFGRAFHRAFLVFLNEMKDQGWELNPDKTGNISLNSHEHRRTKLSGYSFNWKEYFTFRRKGNTTL